MGEEGWIGGVVDEFGQEWQEKKLSFVLEDDCDDHHNHSDD